MGPKNTLFASVRAHVSAQKFGSEGVKSTGLNITVTTRRKRKDTGSEYAASVDGVLSISMDQPAVRFWSQHGSQELGWHLELEQPVSVSRVPCHRVRAG